METTNTSTPLSDNPDYSLLEELLPDEDSLTVDDMFCEVIKSTYIDEPHLISYKLLELLHSLNLNYVDRETTDYLVNKLELISPWQIYLILGQTDDEIYNAIYRIPTLSANPDETLIPPINLKETIDLLILDLANNKTFCLSDYLAKSYIPCVSPSIAHKLTMGFKDIDDFYNELKKPHNQLYLIADRLALDTPELLPLATRIYAILLQNEKELRECKYLIDIREDKRVFTSVYLSDNFNKSNEYLSKSDYLTKLDNQVGEKIGIRQLHLHSEDYHEFEYIVVDEEEKREYLEKISESVGKELLEEESENKEEKKKIPVVLTGEEYLDEMLTLYLDL